MLHAHTHYAMFAATDLQQFEWPLRTGGPAGINPADNPLWYGYLTPSPEKNVWWLLRVQGAFEARVAKVKASTGRMPSLRNYAAREPNVREA